MSIENLLTKKDLSSKDKITLSAIELFAKNGFIPTSVDSIAKKAGLSKGSIYTHFKSKEDIFKAIINSLLEFSEDMMKAITDIKDPLIQLEYIVKQSSEFCKKDPEFARLYMSCFFQPELYSIVKEHISGFYTAWNKMIAGIFKKLKQNNPEDEAKIFLALLDGLQLHYIFEMKGFDIDRLSNNIISKYKENYKSGAK